MSTINTTPPGFESSAPWPLYKLSVDQYDAMIESGIFTERDRLHLINGMLVAKSIPVYWILNLVDRQVEVYSARNPTATQRAPTIGQASKCPSSWTGRSSAISPSTTCCQGDQLGDARRHSLGHHHECEASRLATTDLVRFRAS